MRVGGGNSGGRLPLATAGRSLRIPPEDNTDLAHLRAKAERRENGDNLVAAATDEVGEIRRRGERPGDRQVLRPRHQPLYHVDADGAAAREVVAARLIKAVRDGWIGWQRYSPRFRCRARRLTRLNTPKHRAQRYDIRPQRCLEPHRAAADTQIKSAQHPSVTVLKRGELDADALAGDRTQPLRDLKDEAAAGTR